MLDSLERSRATAAQRAALSAILNHASGMLWPKLKRLVDPNVIDATIRLMLHFSHGALNHGRLVDATPCYVHALTECGLSDHPAAKKALTDSLRCLRARLEEIVGQDWHGIVALHVQISGGVAMIMSEEERSFKPQAK